MTVVARFGKPDLFITFTCNPNWPEIKNNLFKHQKWENRPDLICRVFQMKLLEFINDIVRDQLYGVVINNQYVIEFQKRGLPHAHIVVTFHEDDKLKDVEMVERIINAYIPDRENQPLLYQRVADFHLHPPCGRINPEAPCMADGKCTKYYPKSFREKTSLSVGRNTRPEYRRPADGREIFVAKWNRPITNRRVVPYNPYALAKYQCHINFEAVGSLQTIKYLHKYINKGPDNITLYVDEENTNTREGQRIDEIQQYIDSRYVSGMEATWRTLQFRMHGRSHSVLVLPVHLPGERKIIYNEDDDVGQIQQRLEKPSKLEAWFTLNRSDVNARKYKYAEIPEHYVWDNKNAKWYQRSQVSKQIGCMVEISPSEARIEKFFLRILLKRIRGATSFDDLLTTEDGSRCETFREACQKRNWLIQNDSEYEKCLREAELHHHPRKFRKLFSLICSIAIEDELAQLKKLWLLFRKSLMADFKHNGMSTPDAESACLKELNKIISRSRPSISLADLGIVHLSEDNHESSDTDERTEEPTTYSREEEYSREIYKISALNKDQKVVFLRVLKACARKSKFLIPLEIYEELGDDVSAEQIAERTNENIFYLDGPGGTGKTFLYNTLITVLNDVLGKSTAAVAWTGIAANILKGGTTVHRSFRLPPTLSDKTSCGYDL
ncbi:uncharacterized protein LOC123686581 [Harmonia axyridis]|uniref:uncharacterized protein LOC123686581 n=1 Tax=Harmonia axyridis TaxID=115357 RepID=UPI001E278104|nr:uncharacterized protein LOC123686581 [Harmonia axyridis]